MSETSPAVSIRPMYATDLTKGFLETLAALSEVNLTLDEARAVFQKRMRSRVQTYVAVVGEQVVGTASLLIEPKFLHRGGVVGHIEDVSVRPEFQHQHIGGDLVDHLLEQCRRAGCYKVVLDCHPKLFDFYKRHGFRPWAEAMRIDLPRTEESSAI